LEELQNHLSQAHDAKANIADMMVGDEMAPTLKDIKEDVEDLYKGAATLRYAVAKALQLAYVEEDK
jgi:hypothetical protein